MLLKIGKNIASDQILYPRFHSIRSNVITHRAIRNQFISWSLERLDEEFGFEWEKKIDGTRKIEVAKLRRDMFEYDLGFTSDSYSRSR